MRVKKAVIPAAGLGTRFFPVAKGVPKEMLNIVDKPSIHYIVEEAVASGIEEILIIVSAGKESIKKYFSTDVTYKSAVANELLTDLNELLSKVKISYAEQVNLDGNGGAVLLAKEFANGEPVAVLFGDDITYSPDSAVTKQLIDAYERTGGCCILGCQEVAPEEAVKYGVVKKGECNGRLTEMLELVEKPAFEDLPSNLCSLGRFVLPNSIFEELENAPVFKGEIYLTVAIAELMKKSKVYAYNFEGVRYDLGDKFGFLKANFEYGLRSQYGARYFDMIKEHFHGKQK
ncbi:MAG: sugar phosphate nucleotidyltransferase [Bacillota bacterium]